MPKGLHDKIKQNVKKAHPSYSGARQEQETNAVLATIAKRKMKKTSARSRTTRNSKKGKKK